MLKNINEIVSFIDAKNIEDASKRITALMKI